MLVNINITDRGEIIGQEWKICGNKQQDTYRKNISSKGAASAKFGNIIHMIHKEQVLYRNRPEVLYYPLPTLPLKGATEKSKVLMYIKFLS